MWDTTLAVPLRPCSLFLAVTSATSAILCATASLRENSDSRSLKRKRFSYSADSAETISCKLPASSFPPPSLFLSPCSLFLAVASATAAIPCATASLRENSDSRSLKRKRFSYSADSAGTISCKLPASSFPPPSLFLYPLSLFLVPSRSLRHGGHPLRHCVSARELRLPISEAKALQLLCRFSRNYQLQAASFQLPPSVLVPFSLFLVPSRGLRHGGHPLRHCVSARELRLPIPEAKALQLLSRFSRNYQLQATSSQLIKLR